MNKEQVKARLGELQEKQQDFVIRIGEARDLLAELMFTSEAFFEMQKRELIHKLTNNCDHPEEDQYTKDGIVFCNLCGESLRFVEDIELVSEAAAPFNFDLEKMKQAIESPVVHMPDDIQTTEQLYDWLLNCTFESEDPPKKLNYCSHNDCGFCFASKDVVTNAINGGCFKPQECPANQG